MGNRKADNKAGYNYDFFKPVYSNKQHNTVDFYCRKEGNRLYFLVEVQLFSGTTKEPLMIEGKLEGNLEIASETHISEDLREKLTGLIKGIENTIEKNSGYSGFGYTPHDLYSFKVEGKVILISKRDGESINYEPGNIDGFVYGFCKTAFGK